MSAPTEGALAPELLGPGEPVRQIPGLRKRERTWKDEVRERVHHRRSRRQGELPLFPDEAADAISGEDERSTAPPEAAALPDPHAVTLDEVPLRATSAAAAPVDVPLRGTSEAEAGPSLGTPAEGRELTWRLDMDDEPRREPAPVERPASAAERAQAALLDLALLLPVALLVVYGAARAAQAEPGALGSAWPWMAAFLAGLGLAYAGYFTGISGRTLGKVVVGLRVLGPGDVAPGWGRATMRAALGAFGILLAGSGLVTVLFDPARRAVHDRLLHTRVVRS